MRKNSTIATSLILSLLVAMSVRAVTRDVSPDRYHAIPERNAFGLKPQEQPAVQPPAAQPLRKLLLTGITTLGYKRALLKAEPLPGHQGEKEESMILTEGQREGDIEVVQIDEKAGRVTVNNSGTLLTLSFEKDAPKIQATAPVLPTGASARGSNATPPAPLPSAAPTPTGRKFSRRAAWPMNAAAAATATQAAAATEPTSNAPTGPSLPADLTPQERAIVLELQQRGAANNANEPMVPPDTLIPANPGASAPALSPPGFKPPQTTTPAEANPTQPVMPQ